MKFEEFKDKLFVEAKKVGFSDVELYRNKNSSIDLRVFKGEVDHYALNDDDGFAFRGLYNGKMGYSYTEILAEEELDFLVTKAKENAEIIDKEEGEIYPGADEYPEVNIEHDNFFEISPEDKIELVKELEEAAYAVDDKIEVVNYCLYADLMLEEELASSFGLNLSNISQLAYLYLSVVAAGDRDKKSAGKILVQRKFADFEPHKLAEKVANEAVVKLGAKSIKSGEYPVILRNDVAGDLLETYASTLSAENVQKGLSLFKGKLNRKVGVDNLTLVDDPFYAEGLRTTSFDSEGFPTSKKEVISNGILTTYLYNLKTARRDGVNSTGNAYRGSHKSSVGIAPTNLYIKPGSHSLEQLQQQAGKVLLITDLQGLHSGANAISGDFSLSAEGHLLEDGKMIHPVEQITISGNFLELLQLVVAIGDDLEMGSPGRGHIGSPSLFIEKMAVGGE
ncbi:MAG: TldD/PmbA family protein [Bacillota bacterium]